MYFEKIPSIFCTIQNSKNLYIIYISETLYGNKMKEPSEKDFRKYLGHCLKYYSNVFYYEFKNYPVDLPNYSDTDIEKILDDLHELKWLVYFDSEPAFPNPLTIIKIAKEVGITIPFENIPNKIRKFLETGSIKPYDPIRSKDIKKYSDKFNLNNIDILDFEDACEALHLNIHRIIEENDQIYLIASRDGLPVEIIKCLYQLTRTEKFDNTLRPESYETEFNDEVHYFKYYQNPPN
ncbi:MAG: hypothetical protein HeimC3_11140 [Candidatus Heimdallarchaeota archaeon LC_3]|nr:MAG: hypothetical protein HeimC3_11140 [Candidatus Heimdallarchaeota archaeon LC_3]